jgi:hypothetical protein
VLRVTLHPSLQILRSEFPVAEIWAMNTGRTPLCEIADWAAQDVLLLRPHDDVAVTVLAPGEAAFLSQLQTGAMLAQAAAAALAETGAFNLATALAALFTRGAVIAIPD